MWNRSRIFITTSLLLGGLLGLGTGCSSTSQAGAVPQTGLTVPVLPASGKDVRVGSKLFVADYFYSEVLIYRAGVQNPHPIGSISNGVSDPFNLAVDRDNTLYVQNGNNTVTEYPKDETSPSTTLTEPSSSNYDSGLNITVGRDLTVYTTDHLASKVFEFKPGYTTPTTILSVAAAYGLALDSHNNLYVGWSPSFYGYPGHVVKFKPGATIGKDLGITVGAVGGLAIDKADDLLVGDANNGAIDVFKPHAKTPFRKITTYPVPPYQFALDKYNKYLYMVAGFSPDVWVYDYATGALAWTDTQGLFSANGVALRPVAKP